MTLATGPWSKLDRANLSKTLHNHSEIFVLSCGSKNKRLKALIKSGTVTSIAYFYGPPVTPLGDQYHERPTPKLEHSVVCPFCLSEVSLVDKDRLGVEEFQPLAEFLGE